MSKNEELAELGTRFQPATIEADFDAMRERLGELLAPYADMSDEALSKYTSAELRTTRASVNKIINDVEDGRKAIKRQYMAPYDEFAAKVRELLGPAQEAADQLGAMLTRKTEAAKAKRREGLERTYEDFAPALVPVVPFDRILEPKWLNASTKPAKAAEELEAKVAKVASDWEALKARQGDPFYAEGEAAFFRTLDVASALSVMAARAEEQARIDAMRAEVEAYREEAQAEPEAAPESTEAAEPAPEVFADEQASTWYLRVVCTEPQRAALLGFLREAGIHGSIGKSKEALR